jgi:hypothetical protein
MAKQTEVLRPRPVHLRNLMWLNPRSLGINAFETLRVWARLHYKPDCQAAVRALRTIEYFTHITPLPDAERSFFYPTARPPQTLGM